MNDESHLNRSHPRRSHASDAAFEADGREKAVAVPEEPSGSSGTGPGEVSSAPDGLAALARERDQYLDALQRLKAEFDNFRKRTAREQEAVSARAAERLIKQLVPMLDDLERAVEAAVEHGELKLEDGVRLVHRALANMLSREGLVEVETEGQFDPHTQEALLSQPSEEPEGAVIQVVQKGYRLGDHVLRPARVVVSAGTPPGEAPA